MIFWSRHLLVARWCILHLRNCKQRSRCFSGAPALVLLTHATPLRKWNQLHSILSADVTHSGMLKRLYGRNFALRKWPLLMYDCFWNVLGHLWICIVVNRQRRFICIEGLEFGCEWDVDQICWVYSLWFFSFCSVWFGVGTRFFGLVGSCGSFKLILSRFSRRNFNFNRTH